MKAILGRKVSMTQYFDEEGQAHAATIVEAGPATVTALKTLDRDGYEAVQVGFGTRKEKNVAQAQKKQWGDMGAFALTREFSTPAELTYAIGDSYSIADVFEAGDTIAVSGISKGKGFQGVVKRYNFAGGRRSHGQKHSEREPGSIGATGPARVFKGTRMAGRMGTDRVTVKNLRVLALDPETNTLLIKGAVPGRRGTVLEIVKTS
ncbi:50S ribosomal protein L3 [Candidatus Nomurabacteria bacterium]|nr:50S ribosomal protein L3 [Candidatus Nomurabacteria bacterium]